MVGPNEIKAGIVYLSGPMSGIEDFNFPEFNRIACLLRDQDFVVLNPAETAGGVDHLPREWYFRFDFAVIQTCEAVILMEGWERSAGAKAEIIYAHELGLPIFEIRQDNGRITNRVEIENTHVEFRRIEV